MDGEVKSYKFMPRVAVIPWPGKPDCYVCLSGSRKPDKTYYGPNWHGEREATVINEYTLRSSPRMTFSVHVGKAFAEWDGEYGPITVWLDATDSIPEGYTTDDVQPHWFFEKAVGPGNWSLLAVDRNNLPRCFIDGCYDLIFETLRRFATDADNPEANA